MDNDDDDDGLPAGEQHAFSDTYDLIKRLVEDQGLSQIDVGKGVLTAALSCLRKALSEDEVGMLLYEAADDYATRHLRDD